MRTLLSTYLLHSASAEGEDGTSLMQRRFIKQQGEKKGEWFFDDVRDSMADAHAKVTDWWAELWEDDHSPVFSEEVPAPADPEHICGQWSDWSECSTECGGGLESRTYTFLDGAKCGESCPHGNGDKQQRECNTDPCVVDCEGEWGAYSACSATCGGGVQSRMFTVSQEKLHGGQCCEHANGFMEDSACSQQQCEKNCAGHWDDWSECSNGGAGPKGMECGPGASQSRTYNVTQEHTSAGCGCSAAKWADLKTEVDVDASSTDTRECQLPCCPEPCEGSWGSWGTCEGPNVKMQAPVIPSYGYTGVGEMQNCCGGGIKTRAFSVAKDLVCGGRQCEAANGMVDSSTCCEAPCPVDCEGHWSEPGECCSSCGGGKQERVWVITQEALHGGKQCDHKLGDIKREGCNEDIPCPVDCEGHWSEWDQCTDECGPDGTQDRHWIVDVESEHGGAQCSQLDQVQLRSCDPEPVPCPIDAVCTWTEFGECSDSCYDTETPTPIIKTREWVEISPAQHGGVECKDTPPQYELPEAFCHQPNCPIDCIGEYGPYNMCNARIAGGCAGDYFCGRGTQTKFFHISKEAMYGGVECPHEDGHTSSKVCGDVPCPIDCEGNFTEWNTCCSDCGGGSQAREFKISVKAQFGGCQCEHVEHVEHQACNEHPCPVDCEGHWGDWGTCSQECTDCRNSGAVGIKQSSYVVSVPAAHGGLECPHTDGEIKELTCNEHCCPENCEGSWSAFSECSTTCGNGVTGRTFTVSHKEAFGGKPCPYCDQASHTTECNGTSPCAIDCSGGMTEWSQCSDNCGGGVQSAWFIHNVPAQNGGQDCEYGQFEQVTRECNTDACPQMCLGAFGPWGTCDADCSGGTKKRTFMVFRPAAGGGPECSHASGDVDEASCNEHDCPDGYVCPPVKTCKYSNGLIQRR